LLAVAGQRRKRGGGVTEDGETFKNRLAELTRLYVGGLPAKAAKIDALAAAVGENPAAGDARAKIAELTEIVHQLSGSGGTFGAPRVSVAAAAVEAACNAVLAVDRPATPEEWERVAELVNALGAVIDDAVAGTTP
jgi:HPt (histidine-containing phosphotransfer) domain-containing protein